VPAPLAFPAPSPPPPPRPAHVLVLHTYGGDWPMRVIFDQALERAFRADGVAAPVELFHETAEAYRFPQAADTWRAYVRTKYAGTRIDAIVAVWDPALTLLRQHRQELFPGVPVVYIRNGPPDAGDQPAGMTADLAQASRLGSLGELAAGIAHELNQPLAAMITNARATLRRMDSRAATDGYVRDSLQDIVSDGRRASEILSRIIGSIKPESVTSATLSLNELATDVATLTRRTLVRKRVALRLDLEATLPPVKGDRVQLQQVLMNFVLNAVDAMTANNGRPRVVTIRTALEGSRVRLSVADTGPGLPGADAEQLFLRFFTTKPDHMGIGLSLCRRIAEAHGGEVRLARNSPDGATFELEVPAA
jgi:signal transduction histidine kinase